MRVFVANVTEGVVLVGTNLDGLLDALVKVCPTISPTEADLMPHTIGEGEEE